MTVSVHTRRHGHKTFVIRTIIGTIAGPTGKTRLLRAFGSQGVSDRAAGSS